MEIVTFRVIMHTPWHNDGHTYMWNNIILYVYALKRPAKFVDLPDVQKNWYLWELLNHLTSPQEKEKPVFCALTLYRRERYS